MGNGIVIVRNGEEKEYEIIDMINVDGAEYVVYGDGQVDSNDEVIVNVSKLIDNGETLEVVEITDDEEYEKVFLEFQKNVETDLKEG